MPVYSYSCILLIFYRQVNSMCENCECKPLNTVHWFDASCSVTPLNNSITLITSTVPSWATFSAADCTCVGKFPKFSQKAKTPAHWMPCSDQILTQNDYSGSSMVVDFCTNRKRVGLCDLLLLVINTNLGPILHRFGDTTVY